MDEPVKKRVDESWKEQAEREKQTVASPAKPAGPAAAGPAEAAGPEAEEVPQARFDVFLSGLAMEALIALGDAPHPVTRKQSRNPAQARYLVDLLGVLEEKTRGNLTVDEERLLKDVLYQLRTRYLSTFGG